MTAFVAVALLTSGLLLFSGPNQPARATKQTQKVSHHRNAADKTGSGGRAGAHRAGHHRR
jgi:hypothetical protein